MTNSKRLKKLEELIIRYGSCSELETRAKISKSYISHVRSGRRPLSDALVTRIETNLGLPPGWFDKN